MAISREQACQLEQSPGEVLAVTGERIGALRRIRAGLDTDQPVWASVDVNRIASGETLVPLEGASLVNADLRLAYDRVTVLNGPVVSDGQSLLPEEERQLYDYYGLIDQP